MSRPVKAGDPTERTLAARFAQLRVAERTEAPDFPAEELLATAAPSSWGFAPAMAAALAAGIVGIALFFVTREPVQDPGELYASIMAATEITTDQLMSTSRGSLPESAGIPVIYEIDIPALKEKVGE